MNSKTPREAPPRTPNFWRRWAWLPIPLLVAAMLALWVADLRVVWDLQAMVWLIHYGPVVLGVAFIVIPAALSFLANGQPSVLMLGCGILIMDIGVIVMPNAFARSSNTAFAIYNISALLGAVCHFAGVTITSRRTIRVRRSTAWLTAAYAGCAAVMGLVIWAAFTDHMPAFFIEDQGGTLLRGVVVGMAVALFVLTAGLLWQTNRRAPSPFLFWYALGLVLLAAGLAGSMLIGVRNSPLQWAARLTQTFGTIYMCVAVVASWREDRAKGLRLDAVEDAWRENEFLALLRRQTLLSWVLRYGVAVMAVAVGLGFRQVLTAWVGPGLPTYVTFYPAVMAVALLAGFGPGLVATALTGLSVSYWVLPPAGFAIESPVERLGLAIFAGMGLFMSVVAQLYRRDRDKAAAYEREAILREGQEALRQQAELIDPVRAEVIAREMLRVVRERGGSGAAPAEATGEVLRRVPGVTGAAIACVGLMVLMGWALGLDALKSIVPGMATMKANTALCFMLAGTALALHTRRGLRLACAGVVCAVAALSLMEYATGASFGFDNLLVRDWGDPYTVPGRMAQATALAFLFSGTSLWLLRARSQAGRWTQQALAAGVGLIGIVAVLGYLYQEQRLYSFAASASMALPTAAAFMLLTAGLICARTDGVVSVFLARGPGGELARRLLPAALVVPAFLGWIHLASERAGIFHPALGTGIFVLAIVFSFAAIIWSAAYTLTRSDAVRLEIETQLRNQTELMDHAREVLIVREFGGAIRSWNHGAEILYGWPAADVLGQSTHVLLHTAFVSPEGQRVEDMDVGISQAGHWEGELVHTTRDGRHVTVDSRQTALRAPDGHVLILESNRDITERKWAEEEVRANREWLRVTLTSIGDAVIAGDTETRITFMNPVAAALTGWTEEEALGQPVWRVFNIINEVTRERGEAPCARALKEKRVVGLANHTALITKDGREIPVEDSAAPILGADGNVTGVVLVFHDVTEKRRAQKALEQRETELRDAQHLAHVGSWHWDAKTDVTTGSDELLQIYGFDPNTQRMADFREQKGHCYPVEDWERVNAAVQRTVETGVGYELDVQAIRNGELIWVTTRGEAVRDADGQIVSLRGTVQDITERKRAEGALRESEERFRALFENMQEGFAHCQMVLDDEGRPVDFIYLNVNDAFGRLTGLENVAGKRVTEVLPGIRESHPELFETYARVARTGQPARFEIDFKPLDMWLAVSVYSSQPGHFAAMFDDITERKRAEEALRTSRVAAINLMEDSVEARQQTEQANAALRHSRDRLAIIADTISALLGTERPQDIVNTLCERVMEHLDCHAFFNFLADEPAGRLHLNAYAGIPPEEALRIEWLDYGVAVCGCAAQQCCRIVAEHIPSTPDPRTELVKSFGIKAYACHPLLGPGEKVIGTLSFGTRSRETFSDDDLALMKTVADHVAVALGRMQGQQALQRNEATLRGILEATQESVWMFSPEGVMLMGNAMALTRFGKPAGEIIGKHFTEILPDELAQSRLARLREVVESGQAIEFEDQRADILFHHSFYPVFDEGKRVVAVAGFSRDITQRKRAEEALRRAHEQLVLAQQSSGAGIWDWDLRTGKLEWSPELFKLFGLDPGETEADFDMWRAAMHPEDREMSEQRVYAAIQDHTRFENEYRVVWPTGEVRWINALGNTTYGDHDEPVRMSGICLDITERRHSEAERERLLVEIGQRAAEVEAVFSAQHDVVLVYDTEMNVRRVNPAFIGLYGFDPVGLNVRDIIQRLASRPLDGRPLALEEQPTPRALRGEHVTGAVFRVKRADGTEAVVETSSGPMRVGDRIAGAVTVWHDLSERIKHEEELRKLNRTLQAHSHSDQAMMRAMDEEEYAQEACRIIVEDCGYAMVWVGLAEDDKARTVRPVASAGFEEGYLETLRITWSDTERGRGPTGTAIRTGKPSLCRDMRTDPRFAPWRKEALKRGYGSSLVLPMTAGKKTLGAITIYSRQPDGFAPEEVKLLSELADDLAFGIAALRVRGAHAETLRSLQQSEERYRSLFEGMTEGFALHEIITDEDGVPCDYRFLEINPAFERLTGLKAENAVGRRLLEVLPEESEEWIRTYGQVALTGDPVHFENYSAPLQRWYEVFAYRPAPRQFAVIFLDITYRKQAEKELEILSRFPAESPSPVLRISSDQTLLYHNPASEPLLESWRCRLGEPVPGTIRQHVDAVLATGRLSEFELVAGDSVFAMVFAPVLEFGYVNVYGRDVTERFRAQAELAEANALLERRVAERTQQLQEASQYVRNLIEASLDPLVTINPDGQITDVNLATELATGVSSLDLVGSDFSDIFTEPDKAREGYQRVLTEGQVTDYPLTIRHASGRTVDVLYNATVFRNEAGEVQGVFAAARDVTQLKRAEEALRTSEKLLAEAQRIAHLGGWDWNVAADVLTWSDEMFRLFGFEPRAFPVDYARFLECVHPEDRASVTARVTRALEGADPYDVTYRIVLPDQTQRILHAQAEVVRDEAGTPLHMIGTVMDITEQVRAEEEAKIRQQQLIQADKMVSLGILVSGVAHEINNPNHSIMTNVASLGEVWDSTRPILDRFYDDFGDFVLGGFEFSEARDKIPGMFTNAVASSKRIQVIVDELRDFARSNPKEAMAGLNANAVIESAVVLIENMVKKATDRFSIDLAEKLPTVLGNQQRLEQVVINLIQNACRSLPGKDKAICVRTVYSAKSEEVRIEVEDEGVGIPEEDLRHLGDPFFTTSRAAGGMGLGLWVSFNIVREHGGTLQFFSEVGQGTRAVLSLPVRKDRNNNGLAAKNA